jgi:transcription elongation factor Elf1
MPPDRKRKTTIRAAWATKQRGEQERQIKCLTASRGHLWMRDYYDRLPASVRRRLAQSEYNICAACMDIEAHRIAKGTPSIEVYNRVIDAIERELRG